jgi:hypothetical protein
VSTGVGCGKKGPPLPPEPRGPFPPEAVQARQIGRRVEVGFMVPQARGSNPAQQPVRAELLRVTYPAGMEAPTDPDAFRWRGELVAGIDADPLTSGKRLYIDDRDLAALPDGGTGSTLRYAVRVRDRRGRPSPLVVAADLIPLTSLPAPDWVSAEPTADGIRLVWRGAAADEERRFNLYRATARGRPPDGPLNKQALTVNEYLDERVATGERYDYWVRPVLGEGLPYREGEPSAVRRVVAEDRFAPARPSGLVAVQEGEAVRLFWNPGGERDLAGYRIYRRVDGGPWERVGADPIEQPLYLDGEVRVGQRLVYEVTAVDRASPPNESGRSEPVELGLSAEPVAPGSPDR